MTLIDAILKAENDEERKYKSPPPEIDESFHSVKIKRPHKYAHVQAKVDSSPPRYVHSHKIHALETWSRWFDDLFKENVSMLTLIRQAHFLKGRVDSHWHRRPIRPMQHYWNRVDFLKRVHRENLMLYNLIITTPSRLPTTVELNRDWVRNKRKIVMQANNKFVLFSPVPYEEMEDQAFKAAADVKRPRVYIKLGMRDGAAIGELCIELFTEVCPDTCNLFLDLLDGDTLGHGYAFWDLSLFLAFKKYR
nr:uncharacterized protein LOC110381762 [Helicoverpa armigera]